MLASVIFRVACKQRTRGVQLRMGLHKGSPGEFRTTQSLPLGALLNGLKGLGMRFLGPEFSVVSSRLGICLVLLGKSEPGGSSCMWGCIKAPLGSSLVLKAFLWGRVWMGEKGSESVFWGPSFQSSPMPARPIFSVARKERTRRVQLRVGLHKGSPGEFSCTQSLPLGALLDG